MFEIEGAKKSQNSPISPTLFPHCMEKEGAKQNQNTSLSERCPLLSRKRGREKRSMKVLLFDWRICWRKLAILPHFADDYSQIRRMARLEVRRLWQVDCRRQDC
jgi:hypothetical protein